MRAKTLIDAVTSVTSKWAKQRKQEERDRSARANRGYVMRKRKSVTAKEAAGRLLGAAWLKASGDAKYPASARQIYYAVRTGMQALTGKPVKYDYFSQELLPNHIEENRLDWDVTYDARGNFSEPHTGAVVPLSTLKVRAYLRDITNPEPATSKPALWIDPTFPTAGPKHRFGAVLFLEKEGFGPLLDAARIAERFDIAIMSTKGMSVTAARKLVEDVCAAHDIPLLVLHDFDASGFTIFGTLKESTRRYQFSRQFRVVDLGLRLVDVTDLEPEPVSFREDTDLEAKAATLRRYGATEEEVDFLLDRQQRVELNAMTSPQFVEFVERKLLEHGIGKVVPDADTLHLAALRVARIAKMQKAIDALSEEPDDETATAVPEDLEARVRKALDAAPASTWDAVLVRIMGGVRS